MNHQSCLWRCDTFSSMTSLWKEETKNYIFLSKKFLIYIAGTHLVDPSVCQILKLIKNNAQHSLWHICEAVWLLPEKAHVVSINEFKSSRAKVLTLPWVSTCFNLWTFVRVSYSNCLLLWKTHFKRVTSQPLFNQFPSQISEVSFWWYCICSL